MNPLCAVQVTSALEDATARTAAGSPALLASDAVYGHSQRNDTPVAVLYGALGAACLQPLHHTLVTASTGAHSELSFP